MPTYEYTCRDCGEDTEAIQSFSDDPLTICPKCGGELRKVFRSVGIVFKGSGFYKTDSRTADATAKSTTPTSETNAGDAKPSEAKTGETKPSESPSSETKAGVTAPVPQAPAAATTT